MKNSDLSARIIQLSQGRDIHFLQTLALSIARLQQKAMIIATHAAHTSHVPRVELTFAES